MKIYGLEKLSMVDFGGLCSAVLFTGGCNFKCPFCHNSSLVNLDFDAMDEQYVFDYLSSRKKLLDGVVVSGGEPTIHHDLPELLKRLKDMGFQVKLDTNGTNYEMLKSVIEQKLVDFVAMDIKNSPEMYGETVGIKNVNLENILKSIKLLKSGVVDYEFRTTIINEFHSEESIKKMGEMITNAKVLYLQKFVDNGTTINGDTLSEVPIDKANKFKTILSGYVDKVYLRGY